MSSPQSLPDRLAKALIGTKYGAGVGAEAVERWTRHVTEALVPAVLAALTVPPDGRITDDGADVPYWDLGAPLYDRFAVWPDGIDTKSLFHDHDVAPVDEVERAGLVLLSVAAEMRRHSAWTGETQ